MAEIVFFGITWHPYGPHWGQSGSPDSWPTNNAQTVSYCFQKLLEFLNKKNPFKPQLGHKDLTDTTENLFW